jgi:hypothetical protein
MSGTPVEYLSNLETLKIKAPHPEDVFNKKQTPIIKQRTKHYQ